MKASQLATKRCSQHRHPEIILRFSQVLESDVRFFARLLENMVASGSRFQVGQTLQVGWVVTRFAAENEDLLGLDEPDMKSFPIEWLRSVSNTVRLLRLHKDIVESVLPVDRYDCPSLSQACLICRRLDTSLDIIMDRTTPKNDHSGWFVGCVSRNHDHNDPAELLTVSMYEAFLKHNSSLPYFALPAGTSVWVENGYPTIWLDGVPLKLQEGSFLHQSLYSHTRRSDTIHSAINNCA